jgi:hypothetical protein
VKERERESERAREREFVFFEYASVCLVLVGVLARSYACCGCRLIFFSGADSGPCFV